MEKQNSRLLSIFACFSSPVNEDGIPLSAASSSSQTVSKKEQVGLPSASSSTQTVSKKEQVGLPSASSSTQTVSSSLPSCGIPVASNPACSAPLAESMENKNSRWFSRFSCFSTSASSSSETVSDMRTSSSETVSDMIKAIREEAENSDLDAIIQRLYALLEAIKTQQELPKKTQRPKESQKKTQMPTSDGFSKLKDLLLEGVNGICSVKDALPDHEAKQVVRDVVKGIGQTHWVTSCFLLVSYILDRYETLSSNREGCMDLLEHMYNLAVDLKEVADIKKSGSEDFVSRGTKLIVEASLMCCAQIDLSRPNLNKFFTTTVDAQKLLDFKAKLATFNKDMVRKMAIWTLSSLLCKKVRPAVEREELHPVSAVGIEEPLKSVTKLLHLKSKERAVAVIVHGFGGIGKTTLADAVFARYYVKDCKYSVVMLGSSPDIVTSQKNILTDLMRRTESGRESKGIDEDKILDFNNSVVGRAKIGQLLKKERAFIYIDNVVNPDSLENLLDCTKLKSAKNLRLLITTRYMHVLNQLGNLGNMKRVHEMQPLSHDQGKRLLSEKMYNVGDDNNGQIPDGDLNEIVSISGGIPKILVMISGQIQWEDDKEKACRIVKQDSEKLTGDTFSDIDKSIFAYDDLPDECKNPFLDICFFLEGWKWETVENIVGESQLNMLKKRALVSKDEDMNVRLHDIILKIGKEKARDGEVKARDTRIDFTEAPDDEIQEFFEKDMKHLQLIKGLWLSDKACNIPVTKLNSMKDSLRIFGHKMVLEGQCENIFSKLLVYKGETPHFPFKWSTLKNLTFLSYQPENLNLLKEITSSNLKHIELDGSHCSDREILYSDIEKLKTLQVLRLINFHNLEKLPEEWGAHLSENLKELTLSNCTAMKQLTGFISQLTRLQILKLDNCCNLMQWPEGCESWSCLKNLTFLSCQPQNLNLLKEITSSNLKHIELDGSLCSVSEILPSDIQQLRALQVLRLINFQKLEKLPEHWGESLGKNLKELTLSHCTAMEQLTGSISQLKGLEILKLDNCCNLKQWPKGCESLRSSLKKIILHNCPILKSLPSCFEEALDSDSRRLFQHEKGMLSDSPQS